MENEGKRNRTEKFKTSLEFLAERVVRAKRMAASWSADDEEMKELAALLETAAHRVDEAVEMFGVKIANGWAPPRGVGPQAALAPGDVVRIRDRFARTFHGQLTTDDELVVDEILGRRLVAKDKKGTRYALARNQVRRLEDDGADDEGEEDGEAA